MSYGYHEEIFSNITDYNENKSKFERFYEAFKKGNLKTDYTNDDEIVNSEYKRLKKIVLPYCYKVEQNSSLWNYQQFYRNKILNKEMGNTMENVFPALYYNEFILFSKKTLTKLLQMKQRIKIDWFDPVLFLISPIIGYCYNIRVFPSNFIEECFNAPTESFISNNEMEEELQTDENQLSNTKIDFKEEIKKTYRPFTKNDYYNKSIQRTNTNLKQKHHVYIGTMKHTIPEENLMNIVMILIGSNLWLNGLSNLLEGYRDGSWTDVYNLQLNALRISILMNPNLKEICELNNYDLTTNDGAMHMAQYINSHYYTILNSYKKSKYEDHEY